MLAAIGNAVTQMIGWVGQVISSIVGAEGAMSDLLPVFALGIGISVILFAISCIRKVCWGS